MNGENQAHQDKLTCDYLLVVDLEATCCDEGSIDRPDMETIEIGAVLVCANTYTQIDEFDTFVKPVVHSQLTPFCTRLTGISQADVTNAPIFAEAILLLKQWLAQHPPATFCSWGNYDKYQFQYDCSRNEVDYPFGEEHHNLKALFQKRQRFKRRHSVSRALDLAGIQFEGTPHRGIDDARNIAKLLPFIFGEERISAPRNS